MFRLKKRELINILTVMATVLAILIVFVLSCLVTQLCWAEEPNLFDREPKKLSGVEAHEIAFSKDGKWLAAVGRKPQPERGDKEIIRSSAGGVVKVWDWKTGKVGIDFASEDWDAESVAFNSSNSLMAVGFMPKFKSIVTIHIGERPPRIPIIVWDLEKRTEVRRYWLDYGTMFVRFTRDGKNVAAEDGSEIVVWDISRGQVQKRIGSLNEDFLVEFFDFSSDGRWVAIQGRHVPLTGGGQGIIVQLYDMNASQTQTLFQGDGGEVAFAPAGDLLVYEAFKDIYVYSLKHKKTVWKLGGVIAVQLQISSDGHLLFASCYDEKENAVNAFKAWELNSGRLVLHQRIPSGIHVRRWRVSPDGHYIALGCRDGIVRVWPLPKGLWSKDPEKQH